MTEVPRQKSLQELVSEAVKVEELEKRGWTVIHAFREIVGMTPGKGQEIDTKASRMDDEYALKAVVRLEKSLRDAMRRWTERPLADDENTRKARKAVEEGWREYLDLMAPYVEWHVGRQTHRGNEQKKNEQNIFHMVDNTWNAASEIFRQEKKREKRRAPPHESAA